MSYKYSEAKTSDAVQRGRLDWSTINSFLNHLLGYFSLKSSLTIPSRRKPVFTLLFFDGLVSIVAWVTVYKYRFDLLHKDFFTQIYLRDFAFAFFIIPFSWCFLYYLSGTYFDLYRKSRLDEVKRTLVSCFLGTIIVALIAFPNDALDFEYVSKSSGRYILLHTTMTLVVRLIYLTIIRNRILSAKVSFNTLIVGGNQNAIDIYTKTISSTRHFGNLFKGFVYSSLESSNGMSKYLKQLGNVDQLEKIIDDYNIEEVIVAVDSDEHGMLKNILLQLSYRPVYVRILPDLYDIISGSVKINSIYDDTLFISISPRIMPDWQKVCKRIMDIFGALTALILFSPVYIYAAIKVWRSSPGPIVYRQERIGLYGEVFKIYKFRSMFIDSEIAGPSLSSDGDPRITRWGRIMRKYRIDELPQFFNVLKGDMSLVGPRPERQFFIDIISETQPEYRYLHKVRPGITSWGMVKYGYAENVGQMMERMRYDLLYIENCSLVLDIKIILHTVATVVGGHGK